MIRKLMSGDCRISSREQDSKTGRRRNLGTADTEAAQRHEGQIAWFKEQ